MVCGTFWALFLLWNNFNSAATSVEDFGKSDKLNVTFCLWPTPSDFRLTQFIDTITSLCAALTISSFLTRRFWCLLTLVLSPRSSLRIWYKFIMNLVLYLVFFVDDFWGISFSLNIASIFGPSSGWVLTDSTLGIGHVGLVSHTHACITNKVMNVGNISSISSWEASLVSC